MSYELLLFLHIVGACVLLGTGAGIAFFMVMSNRSGDPLLIAHTTGIVVLADMVFTATAVVVQPITGLLLAVAVGWNLSASWLVASLVLYVAVGLFWLPVVWMQVQMRRMAVAASESGQALPQAYHRLYGVWFACGIPAFLAVLGIIWLMISKPEIW